MLPTWTNTKKKAVTFSYDDGVTQDIRLVELLNKYGLKCTFNLNSQLLGGGIYLMRQGKKISHYKLKPQHIKEIYEGHEIAAHTLDHPNLTGVSDSEIIRQVEQDRLNLEKLTGIPVVGMAYPGGGINNNEHVANVIKENTGIKYCRTTKNTDSFDLQEDLYRLDPNVYHIMELGRLMSMGKEFIEMNPSKPQVFYIWGHSYEMDFETDSWAKLEEFFRLISGHNDIFYGTNKEVFLP